MTVRITNQQQAIEFIESFNEETYNEDDVIEFGGELQKLEIIIEGEGFTGEITGELARALANYQDAIYAVAKAALRADVGQPYLRLSNEQRRAFELSISVEEGCTDIKIDFAPIMKGLQSSIKKMNPKTVAAVIVVLAFLATGGITGYHLGGKALENADKSNQREHVERTLKAALDSNNQVTEKAFELLEKNLLSSASPAEAKQARSIVSAMANAQTVGVTELAKAAPAADSIEFGATKLDKDAIAAINKRAPRSVSERIDAVGHYKFVAETTPGTVTKLTFHGEDLPAEITVDFIEAEFDKEQADLVWEAIRTREALHVKLEATLIRGTIKGGILADVIVDK